MSCTLAFVACLVFVLLLLVLLRSSKAEGPVPRSFKEAFAAFQGARKWRDRAFVIFLCSPILFEKSSTIGFVIVALPALLVAVAICGSSANIALLKAIRDILLQVYEIVRSAH